MGSTLVHRLQGRRKEIHGLPHASSKQPAALWAPQAKGRALQPKSLVLKRSQGYSASLPKYPRKPHKSASGSLASEPKAILQASLNLAETQVAARAA